MGKTKINFNRTAFILVKPPSRIISHHKIKTYAEYDALIAKATESGYCLYSATMVKKSGKYFAIQPWQLNTDTIPQNVKEEPEPEQPEPNQMCCPFCDKPMNSTSGRTLHVKSNHGDRLEEYKKWLKSLGKKSKK
jgi:hypothetical protein